jgi:CDP-glucose 4,6-dehydratase
MAIRMISNLKIYKNKKILITGSTGFKGSWLAIWLQSMGADVYGYALKPITKKDNFLVSNLDKKITQEYGNISNYRKLKNFVNKVNPDIIFHLAAQPIVKESYENPLETLETNVMGTANLFDICRNNSKIKVLINVTSDKCYLNLDENKLFTEDDKLGGKDIYSASKACSEIVNYAYYHSFFKDKDLSIASVRAGNVIGGGDWQNSRIVPDAIRAYEANQELLIRMPNATRPWQHVLEPLMGYLLLAANMYDKPKKYDGAWNFGPSTRKNLTVGELVSRIGSQFKGLKYKTINNDIYEPNYLRLSSLKAKKKLRWEKILTDKEMIHLIAEWYLNYEKEDMYNLCSEQIKYYLERYNARSN